MKTITLGELFTEQQLRQAVGVLSAEHSSNKSVHLKLVAILEPGKARFDQLEVDINYAAYILEWKGPEICKEFGK